MSLVISGKRVLAGSILFAVMAAVPTASSLAQQKAATPDFSSNLTGWVGLNGGGPYFEADPGRQPGPVVSDPAHPFVPNGVGLQPTFRIADLTNPNLMPWAKELMKKDIDEILAGKKSAFTAQSSCVPGGVPMFMSYGGGNPVVFPKRQISGFCGKRCNGAGISAVNRSCAAENPIQSSPMTTTVFRTPRPVRLFAILYFTTSFVPLLLTFALSRTAR